MGPTVDANVKSSYFDVYTERAGPGVGLELSRSISNLNIVPKQSRRNGSKRIRTTRGEVVKREVQLSAADLSGRLKNAAAAATIAHSDGRRSDLSDEPARTDPAITASASSSRSASPQPYRLPRKSSLRKASVPRDGRKVPTAPTAQYAQQLSAEAHNPSLTRSLGETDLPYLAIAAERPTFKAVGRSSSTPASSTLSPDYVDSVSRSSTAPSLVRRTGARTESAESMVSSSQWTPTEETVPLSTNTTSAPDLAIQSISEIIGKHKGGQILTSLNMPGSPPVPAIPRQFKSESRSAIPSIEDIIRKNSGALGIPLTAAGRAHSTPVPAAFRSRARTTTSGTDASDARSSVDSIAGEVLQAIKAEVPQPKRALHHARSQPNLPVPPARTRQSSSGSSFLSQSVSSRPPLSPLPQVALGGDTGDTIARYLRSTRLTRLLTLRKPPNHHLTVSLADVGDPYGNPVVVYLGLGSVRYLVALYDELAASLGLRLICIDRWGLGKTGDIPDSRRGFLEWSTVVEEVLEQLEVDRFSILAHSAGAPYALASSIRLNHRIHGSLHLLAPWVSTAAEAAAGSYKWLRYVPSSVIKTAQVAEWKMQAWKLGKPPSAAVQAVGFDPRAPLSSESTAASPVFATFALDDQDGDEQDLPTPRPALQPHRLSPTSSVASSLDQEAAVPLAGSSPSLLPAPQRKPSIQSKKGSKGLFTSLFASPKPAQGFQNGDRKAGSRPPVRSGSQRSSAASSDSGPYSDRADLGTALLRASHAESLRGGTADLMAILERTSKAPGFAYSDVERPVKVWHGLKDEKISLEGVLSLERTLRDCKVNVIPGADHSLMTNVPVIVQVLTSIANEW